MIKKNIKKIPQLIKDNKGFILSIILLFALRWSITDHYKVPTGSMIPTIQINDHLIVNKMAYDLRVPFTNLVIKQINQPKRGDIIVFEFPKDRSLNFVKRLVGVPGDLVEERNGMLWINGESTLVDKIDESTFYNKTKVFYKERIGEKIFTVQRLPHELRFTQNSITIPKDHYLFIGDNRDNSYDGREWGLVHRKDIKGRALFVSYNFNYKRPPFLKRFGANL